LYLLVKFDDFVSNHVVVEVIKHLNIFFLLEAKISMQIFNFVSFSSFLEHYMIFYLFVQKLAQHFTSNQSHLKRDIIESYHKNKIFIVSMTDLVI